MSEVEPQYRTRSVITVRGLEYRTKAKLEKEGWEFVTSTPERLLRTKLNFRRVKRKTPRVTWILAAAGALALVTIIIIGSVSEGATPKPTATPTQPAVAAEPPSATPTPTPSASPETASFTDAEMVAAFQTFAAQRAAAGVVLSKAVTTVTYTNRIVRVTFDPAAAGIDRATFDSVNNFPNLASFMATPVAFNNDIGNQLRPGIDAIETMRPSGESLGAFTHEEILQLNELDK